MSKHRFSHYTVTNLGTLTNPKAINNFGQVVGYTSGDSPQAVLWQPDKKAGNSTSGELYALETLNGPASYAIDINDSGNIIGYFLDGNGVPRVVSWIPLTPNNPPPDKTLNNLNFPALQGSQFDPKSLRGGINNLNYIATNAGPFSHAALSAPPHIAPFNPPIEFDNIGFYYVAGINNQGWFTGARVGSRDRLIRPYCYKPDTGAPLPPSDLIKGDSYVLDNGQTPFGANGAGLSITDVNSNNSVAIATSANDDDGYAQALLWILPDNNPVSINPKLKTASGVPVSEAYANGINNKWQVVGWNITGGTAFLYDHKSQQAVDLNSLINQELSQKWDLVEAMDINDKGQIVGTGTFNNVAAAFLLTPNR
jgi:uncharacterized membrane protein